MKKVTEKHLTKEIIIKYIWNDWDESYPKYDKCEFYYNDILFHIDNDYYNLIDIIEIFNKFLILKRNKKINNIKNKISKNDTKDKINKKSKKSK
jgi:hypothetical protein